MRGAMSAMGQERNMGIRTSWGVVLKTDTGDGGCGWVVTMNTRTTRPTRKSSPGNLLSTGINHHGNLLDTAPVVYGTSHQPAIPRCAGFQCKQKLGVISVRIDDSNISSYAHFPPLHTDSTAPITLHSSAHTLSMAATHDRIHGNDGTVAWLARSTPREENQGSARRNYGNSAQPP
ncbi:hypothetical protein EX30DRAFT_228093 [Ascodesmis nigricans]|uniref:Uncharacterized protein n=1 Tax=Ascodesmis nigricans TaxID=341454 RepID=A0A4S2MJ01_9PEZI|nr:hypothetical protein EX30DRAFT_228093 [Ascodesmis nigricans]